MRQFGACWPEQIEDDRDARILPGFGLADLDPDSLRIYRQMLADKKPGHPFLDHQGEAFLQQLGAWRRDRQSGEHGLTLAGLLMFGTWSAIQEAVPHYFVDYQERPEAKTELRLGGSSGSGRHLVGQRVRFLSACISQVGDGP